MPAAHPDPTRPLRLLGLAAFASMASMRWCDALLPVLAVEFGRGTAQTGAVVWGFAVTYGLMQLVYGPLGDRFGKYTVVCWASGASTLGALASALAPDLGWLTLARVLTGATAAGVIPLTLAWVGDHVPWERRQPVLARLLGATLGGMIAGQWLPGVFAETLGWRAGFVALAALFAVAGLALHRGRGGSLAASAPPADGLSSVQRARRVLARPQARVVLAIVAVEGGFANAAVALAPSHLHLHFGIAVSVAGAMLALYALGGLVYSRGAGPLLARLQPLAMARIGGLLAGLAWLLFALAPAAAWTLPLCALAGLGFYMLHNTLQAQATQMAPQQRGTAMALFACALFLGQSAGMGLASWWVDHAGTALVIGSYGVGLALVGLAVGRMAPDAPTPTDPAR